MKRRDFLAAMACAPALLRGSVLAGEAANHACYLPTYASAEEARRSARETLVYIPGIYTGTGIDKPDYLATIDVASNSKTYGQVVHRLEMPHVGDELHHFGWNACSSCHGDATKSRRYLIVPGLNSSRIHIIDAVHPATPSLHKVIPAEEIAKKTDLSAPHTVHCLADGRIMISMLGNAKGEAPGGFLLLDQDFRILGRWEKSTEGMQFNYDFWYQPRQNVMVSSQWAAPNTIRPGFRMEDVKAGKYGHHLNFWDWNQRKLLQSVDLGDNGLIPLETRFHHDPNSSHGYVGAALSSAIWHWHSADGRWKAENVIQVAPVEVKGWPFPVPGLITDLVLSLDDRWLYFSNWLHGDVRQYDIADPAKPQLTGQIWLGGVLGKGRQLRGKQLTGGPQMLQLSLDGKRLYVSNSLYSSWDNQFYPDIAKQGSYLLLIDCNTEQGGLSLNEKLYVDFGQEPHGPARAHEMRFPGGDSTSDIWV
ncbi:MAG: selenium-binding family protein [Thermoguttaceae bacterium]